MTSLFRVCVHGFLLPHRSCIFATFLQLIKWGPVGTLVHNNLKSFCKRKKPEEDVFDLLTVRA